jgi:hypothetical protein
MVNSCAWFEEPTLSAQLIDDYDAENRKAIKEWGVASTLSNKWDLEWGVTREELWDDEVQIQCEGDIRLRKIRYMLDTILIVHEWERTEAQVALHKAYTIASLPKIYGRQWEQCSARVMAEFGIREIHQLVLGLTPRRFGKTIAVATFCATMLLCVPGLNISTFSTGKRASTLLMQSMMRMMSGVDGANERIVRSNAESLSVAATGRNIGVSQQSDAAKRMAADATTSEFHSYPSSVDGQLNNPHSHTSHIHTHSKEKEKEDHQEDKVSTQHRTHTYHAPQLPPHPSSFAPSPAVDDVAGRS